MLSYFYNGGWILALDYFKGIKILARVLCLLLYFRGGSGIESGGNQFSGVWSDVCGGNMCHSDCCQSVLQESKETH